MCSELPEAWPGEIRQSGRMKAAHGHRVLLLATTLALLLASVAHADRASDSKACKAVKLQIRNVESRMRAGYTAGHGVRLETRLKKLRDKRFRVCR